jgi:hypothetical protein
LTLGDDTRSEHGAGGREVVAGTMMACPTEPWSLTPAL